MQESKSPKGEKHSVIVYSGGLDSTTLLYERQAEVALAVTFSYGNNHAARETECARWHCRRLGVEHLEIDLGFIGRHFASSLTAGAEAIPSGNYDEQNMRSTVVPFRNGIMLSVACGLAESRGLDTVLIASHGGDHAIYPDCREGFVEAMSRAMQEGTYEGVRIDAPYSRLDKAAIVRRGAALGIDYGHTYSCYRGGIHHCGTCGTCRERSEAFRLAGVDDPTVYDNQHDKTCTI